MRFNQIMNIIDKRFPKKFKVRISLFSKQNANYCIEYSYSRLFDNWIRLNHWYDNRDYSSDRIAWYNPILKLYEDAKIIASEFNTIQDIINYQEKQNKKCELWKTKRRNWLNKNCPVDKENIK